MFHSNQRVEFKGFGFFEALLPVLSSAINVGGGIASSYIQAGAIKESAQIQQETQLGVAAVQERIAQLQLQALQASQPPATSTGTTTPIAQSVPITQSVSQLAQGTVAGLPIWMIALIAGGAIFILRK